MKKIVVVVLFTLLAVASASAQEINNRAPFGAGEANSYIPLLANSDVPTFQWVMDRYYLFYHGAGAWGNGWLAKFISYPLAVRGYELREELSPEQKARLETILADAVREETFFVSTACGIDPFDSCSEDFISMLATIAAVKNLYPAVADRVGREALTYRERKYLRLTFSVENGWYSLQRRISAVDGSPRVMMLNHGEENVVYSGLLMVHLNNALYTYALAGNEVPSYYRESWLADNVRSMFEWTQSVATTDGYSYLRGCRTNQGNVELCGDIHISNRVPRNIPAGRLLVNLLGDAPEDFSFRPFDASGLDEGRVVYYDDWNGEFLLTFQEPRSPRAPRKKSPPPSAPSLGGAKGTAH